MRSWANLLVTDVHLKHFFDKLSNVSNLDDIDAASDSGAPTASFILNGEPVVVRRRHPHLLAALREELDVTSPKDACSPRASVDAAPC